MIQSGDILDGRYQVLKKLGSGGFSEVYEGVDVVLGRHVAIKVLDVDAFLTPGRGDKQELRAATRESFHREATIVAALKSPFTVSLYDFGAQSDHVLYMVMELVQGYTLKSLLKQYGRLDEYSLVSVLYSVLVSLREAHSHGLLHRDIKPENIMIGMDPWREIEVKVVDFGIAKTLQEKMSATTRAGFLSGTPRYIAPERISTRKMSESGDLYSLGGVMFYALTGEEIYSDVSGSLDLLRKQCEPESETLPADLEASPVLRGIINKLLHKDVNERYMNTQEVLDDLVLESLRIQAEYHRNKVIPRGGACVTQVLEPAEISKTHVMSPEERERVFEKTREEMKARARYGVERTAHIVHDGESVSKQSGGKIGVMRYAVRNKQEFIVIVVLGAVLFIMCLAALLGLVFWYMR